MDQVIMVPGLGSDATVWKRTIQKLGSDCDCRVGDTFSDTTIEGIAQRVLGVAPDQFALAGISMGAMVALVIAELAPERVTRLALFDTNVRPDTPEQTAQRRAANDAMLAATDLRVLAGPAIAYMVHPDTDQIVRDDLSSMTVRVGAAAYVRQNKAVAARKDLFPILKRIAMPTMIVVGANDLMTPVTYSQTIADAIPGAKLHVIPDCGHLPPIEKPAATAELIRAWLTL